MTELASKPSEPVFAVDGAPQHDVPHDVRMPDPVLRIPWLAVWVIIAVLGIVGTAVASALLHSTTVGILPIIALLVCLFAAGFDATSGRIPNPLTYTAILLGLFINGTGSLATWLGHDPAAWLGITGAGPAFLGFLACAVIGIACLLLAGLGGGDLKLLVAMGSMLGFTQVAELMFWTLAIAVPYALINLLIAGKLNGILRIAMLQLMQIIYLRHAEPIKPASITHIPMALPLVAAMFAMKAMPLHTFMG
jgi:prepilin peptidase CpaA